MNESSKSQKKKKWWYVQSFNDDWLSCPEFQDWLEQVEGDRYSARCKTCDCIFERPNKSALIKHMKSRKHEENTAEPATANISEIDKQSHSSKVAESELSIASFFAERNMPFTTCDHFMSVCQKAFLDSKIAKDLALKQTKLSYVTQDDIVVHERDSLTSVCQTRKFSLIIDENTDISGSKILAIVIRYFDVTKQDVVDELLDTVIIENAQSLYESVKTLLNTREIPLRDIIGFGIDNCSAIVGSESDFQKQLSDDIPSLFVMGCICHSFTLCANDAVSVVPPFLEAFLREVSSYFSRSGKRKREFLRIQKVMSASNHKIPKLAHTQWLSRVEVITVVLDHYEDLKLYFQSEKKSEDTDTARKLYNTLSKCGTKHMLLFLQYILKKVDALNMEFQSEHFRLHQLFFSVTTEYKSILDMFIRKDVLKEFQLHNIDIRDKQNHVSIKDVYLGGRTLAHLINEPFKDEAEEIRFRTDCLNVLVEVCAQIQIRFPLHSDSVLAKLSILDPIIATDLDRSPATIVPLAIHFPSLAPECDLNELDDEWRSHRLFGKEILKSIKYEHIPQYWFSIRNLKNVLNESKYLKLSQFMTALTVLPHSSACVERIFSHGNCIKDRKSNSFKMDTVRHKTLPKHCIKLNGQNSVAWASPKELTEELVTGKIHQR